MNLDDASFSISRVANLSDFPSLFWTNMAASAPEYLAYAAIYGRCRRPYRGQGAHQVLTRTILVPDALDVTELEDRNLE